MQKCSIICLSFWFTCLSYAQGQGATTVFTDTFQTETFLATVENSLFEYYRETWGSKEAYGMIDELGKADESATKFNDTIYFQRLDELANSTPFDARNNPEVLKTIKYFVSKRNRYTSVIIGRSKLYFPMFETILSKHNLPLELKYLPIIESALIPNNKSWAGATGLWQIMYPTGRSLGLHADSYVDDRSHPEKSTEAACQYLKYLYNLYGDWELALSAYNCGPGNVNKAIRRAGNQTNYWAIRPFLPRETQQYVPNFYAALYMMTYFESHQIIPKQATVYFHQIDTVCLKQSVRISHIDSILGIPATDFKKLNPQYKTDIIPETEPAQCIALPINKLTAFFEKEQELYTYQTYLESIGENYVILQKKKIHKVTPDQTLADVAFIYDVSLQDIREWNGLRNSTIYPGQKIVIMIPEKRVIQEFDQSNISSKSAKQSAKSSSRPTTTSPSGHYKYYTLKSGESLWTVSQKLGINFADLQAMNKDLNPKRMKPGQKIKVGFK
ncbi:MAG: transglycosylase SLT domain-containing protein [Crocinitomicaceae bacterium]